MDNFEKQERKIERERGWEFSESDFEIEAKTKDSGRDIVLKQEKIKKQTSLKQPILKDNRISAKISRKMEHFLNLAEEKGLAEAIKKIKEENDPLLLDSFHDALAKEKFFETFLNKKKKPKI